MSVASSAVLLVDMPGRRADDFTRALGDALLACGAAPAPTDSLCDLLARDETTAPPAHRLPRQRTASERTT